MEGGAVARRLIIVLALLATGCGPATVAPSVTVPVETSLPTLAPSLSPTPAPTLTLPDGVAIHPADAANGVPLGYISYVPPTAAAGPKPLLLFLHGSGESGRGTVLALRLLFGTSITKLLWEHSWPAERPFIVLAPQHDDTTIPCFTPDEIDGFLKQAMTQYDIDPTRIYVTGVSCGAIGAWDYLGAHTNELVAAAVLFAGDGRRAFDEAGCRLGLVPIWALHGELDQNVDPAGSKEPVAKLRACTKPKAVDVRLTLYPDRGHLIWDQVYAMQAGIDIYAWMLDHSHA